MPAATILDFKMCFMTLLVVMASYLIEYVKFDDIRSAAVDRLLQVYENSMAKAISATILNSKKFN